MEEVEKKGGTNQVLRKQRQRRERGKEVAGFLGIRSDGRLKSIWLIESSGQFPEVRGQRTSVISPSRHTRASSSASQTTLGFATARAATRRLASH